ncbi:MAG: hypothetical protein QW568_01650 [Candidatus Anstonellaceae archaeon]
MRFVYRPVFKRVLPAFLFFFAFYFLAVIPNLGKPAPEIYKQNVERIPFFVRANALDCDVLGAIGALFLVFYAVLIRSYYLQRIEVDDSGISKKWAGGGVHIPWKNISGIYYATISVPNAYKKNPLFFRIKQRTGLFIKSDKALLLPSVYKLYGIDSIEPAQTHDKKTRDLVVNYLRYAEKNISGFYLLLNEKELPKHGSSGDSDFIKFINALKEAEPAKSHVAQFPSDLAFREGQ